MINPACLSCAVVTGQADTPGGAILETKHFHAHQDVAYPVQGQIIVAARRHFRLLVEMNEPETEELLPLLQKLRAAQAQVLGVDHVYYFYNEDTAHHFHVWMVPRHPWMAAFGRSIEAVRPALLHAQNEMSSPKELEAVHQAVAELRLALDPA